MNRRAFVAVAASSLATTARAGARGARQVSSGEMPMLRGDPAHTGRQPGPGPRGQPVILWRFETNAAIVSSPAVSRGLVYVGSDAGYLFAIDAQLGTVRWAVELGYRLRGTPAIQGKRLYVANGAFNIRQVETGDFLAENSTLGLQMTQSLVPTALPGYEPMVFGCGTRGISGFIDARGTTDGRTLWRHDVVNHVTTSPTVAGDAVYFGTLDGYLVALAVADAALRWRVPLSGGVFAAPAADGSLVYAAAWAEGVGERGAVMPNASGSLVAVDGASGEIRWQVETGNPVESGPALAADLVVVGGGTGVYAVEAATGALRWRFETGAPVRSSSAVADDVVYIGSGNGHLYALDLATGALRWSIAIQPPLDSTAAVVDGVVYVTSGKMLVAVGGI